MTTQAGFRGKTPRLIHKGRFSNCFVYLFSRQGFFIGLVVPASALAEEFPRESGEGGWTLIIGDFLGRNLKEEVKPFAHFTTFIAIWVSHNEIQFFLFRRAKSVHRHGFNICKNGLKNGTYFRAGKYDMCTAFDYLSIQPNRTNDPSWRVFSS